ncbi:MAG: RNA-dependent RNA polymerase [Hangzhou totivirus 9]|nr:MAG: RNA-dependent RNA polymerase [Hangzhou totivirus 9]
MTIKMTDRSVYLSCLQNGKQLNKLLNARYGGLIITKREKGKILDFIDAIKTKFEKMVKLVTKLADSTPRCLSQTKGKIVRAIDNKGDGYDIHPIAGWTLHVSSIRAYTNMKHTLKGLKPIRDPDFTTLYPNFDANRLISLLRCRENFIPTKEKKTTFCNPMAMYLQAMEAVLQDPNHPTLLLLRWVLSCCDIISSKCVGVAGFYCDDIVRQFLASIDSLSFELCQSSKSLSQVFGNLHGLSTMGGPRGWDKDDVIEQIQEWVAAEKGDDCLSIPEVNAKFKGWMNTWVSQRKGSHLSFDQFCRDPMRWATGGGAKKSDIGGETYRTKWSWAMSNVVEGRDQYERAMSEPNVAHVALKEEVKTRTVITTPMASYLRQSYLWYLFGKPKFLKSTISNKKITSQLITTNEENFACIDASKFDHCITKNFITQFYKSIIESTDDVEIRRICQDELESLETLILEYDGLKIPYNNGLLSGWRFTSLIGSMYSALLCEYINSTTQHNYNYITQGDDIIIMSHTGIDKNIISRCCEQFGLTINKKKTTIGHFGEFLKYRYGCNIVQAYAARSVRSIFYAQPWLDDTIVTKPSEISSKWFTVMSRMSVASNYSLTKKAYRWFEKFITNDVSGWAGGKLSKHTIRECLKSPISVGGLGVWETCGPEALNIHTGWVSINTVEEVYMNGDQKLLGCFGIKSSRTNVVSRRYEKTVRMSSIKNAYTTVKKIYANTTPELTDVVFFDNVNIFHSIIERVLLCKSTPPILEKIRNNRHPDDKIQNLENETPRHLRKANRWSEVLSWLLQGEEGPRPPPSLYVDNRYDASDHTTRIMSKVLMYNISNVTANLKFLMSLCLLNVFFYQRCVLHVM